jgi:hypothetical protein
MLELSGHSNESDFLKPRQILTVARKKVLLDNVSVGTGEETADLARFCNLLAVLSSVPLPHL